MITVNGSTQYPSVFTNEAYRKMETEWEKMLVLKFPRSEFSRETATEIATEAVNISVVDEYRVTTYLVSGIAHTETDLYYHNLWLYNPDVEISDNLTSKVYSLDSQLTDAQLALCEQYEENLTLQGELDTTRVELTDTQLALCDVYEALLAVTSE